MPYSGPYGCSIADSRFEILPTRKSGETSLNFWTRSRLRKPEVVLKVPETVRNVVKFTVIRKMHEKNHPGQTGSRFATPEAVVYFGLLLVFTL